MREFLLTRAPLLRRRSLLLVTAGVPLIFARNLNDAIQVPKLGLLLILLPLLIGLRAAEVLQDNVLSPSFYRAAVPAGAVALAMALAWVFTPYKEWALFGHYGRFLGLVPYLLTACLALLVADAFRDPLDLAWVWVVAAVLVAVYGLVQVAGLDPLEWRLEYAENTVASSTIGNPNFTGGYLGMTLPLVIGLWVRDPGKRRLLALAAVPILLCWLATLSAGGWVAGVGAVAVTGGILLQPRWKGARTLGLVLAGGAALSVVTIVLLGFANIESSLVTEQQSRSWLWEAAIGVAGESPVLGSGPNGYAIENVQHRAPEHAIAYNLEYSDDPHNVALAFLANAGIVGLAAFLIVVVWVVRQGTHVRVDQPLLAAFFGVAIAYLIQAMVTVDSTPIRSSFWIAVGALAFAGDAGDVSERRKSPKRGSRRKAAPIKALPAVVVIAVVAAAAAWWGAYRFIGADAKFRHARNLMNDGSVNAAEEAFIDAISRREDLAYRRAYGAAMGNVAVALSEQGNTEPARHYLELATAALNYTNDIPHVHSIIDRARLMYRLSPTMEAARDQAAELYLRVTELDRNNPLLLAEAARVLSELGRTQEALEVLERSFDAISNAEDPRRLTVHPEYWEALATLREQAGDEEGATEARERGERSRAILYPDG